MQEIRRALRALEGHLVEVLDVSDANEVVDRLERTVSEDYLDAALDRQHVQLDRALEQQFFALAAAVAALVGLG